jgi:hypothetical protein
MRITVYITAPKKLFIEQLGLPVGVALTGLQLGTINSDWPHSDSSFFSLGDGDDGRLRLVTEDDFRHGGEKLDDMARRVYGTITASLLSMGVEFDNPGWSCAVDRRTAMQFTLDPEQHREVIIVDFGLPEDFVITDTHLEALNDKWEEEIGDRPFVIQTDGSLRFIATDDLPLDIGDFADVGDAIHQALLDVFQVSLGMRLVGSDDYVYTVDGETFNRNGDRIDNVDPDTPMLTFTVNPDTSPEMFIDGLTITQEFVDTLNHLWNPGSSRFFVMDGRLRFITLHFHVFEDDRIGNTVAEIRDHLRTTFEALGIQSPVNLDVYRYTQHFGGATLDQDDEVVNPS